MSNPEHCPYGPIYTGSFIARFEPPVLVRQGRENLVLRGDDNE